MHYVVRPGSDGSDRTTGCLTIPHFSSLAVTQRRFFFDQIHNKMSTIKRSKRDHPFVVQSTKAPRDKNLSWKAKGILQYLLCQKDDWEIFLSELHKHAKDGRDGTASGFRELLDGKYIIRHRVHKKNGHFDGYDYEVFEEPQLKYFVNQADEAGEDSTINGKTVNGLTGNGKSVSNKEQLVIKNKSNKRANKFAPPSNEEEEREIKNEIFSILFEKLKERKIDEPRIWAIYETKKLFDHYSENDWKLAGGRRIKSFSRTVKAWFTRALERGQFAKPCPDSPKFNQRAASKFEETPTFKIDKNLFPEIKVKKS